MADTEHQNSDIRYLTSDIRGETSGHLLPEPPAGWAILNCGL